MMANQIMAQENDLYEFVRDLYASTAQNNLLLMCAGALLSAAFSQPGPFSIHSIAVNKSGRWCLIL